jgi:hypothetical protein
MLRRSIGNPDVLNRTVPGHVIHQDVFGPTTFINPILIVEIVRETEQTGT